MESQREPGTSVLTPLHGALFFGSFVRGTPFVIPALPGELPPLETPDTVSKEKTTPLCPRFGTKSAPTKETIVEAYGVNTSVTFKEALHSLSHNFAKLAFTECQIREFLNTHIELLRAVKRSTFFLCGAEKEFFIVLCVFWGEFPHVSRFPFDYHYKLEPNSHYHLIVPVCTCE